jgi:hypothetical protein
MKKKTYKIGVEIVGMHVEDMRKKEMVLVTAISDTHVTVKEIMSWGYEVPIEEFIKHYRVVKYREVADRYYFVK